MAAAADPAVTTPDAMLQHLMDKAAAAERRYDEKAAEFKAAAAKWEANEDDAREAKLKLLMDEAKADKDKAAQLLDDANRALAQAQGTPRPAPVEGWSERVLGPVGGCGWKLDEDATIFANELREAVPETLRHGEATVERYLLTKTMHTGEQANADLLVRTRMAEVWKLVRQAADELSSLGHQVSMVEVTGNPGIGKTRSMDFLQRSLLRDNLSYFYDQRDTGVVFAFVSPSDHGVGDDRYRVFATKAFDASSTSLSTSKDGEPPFYLYDPAEKANDNSRPKGVLKYRLIVAASPNEAHTHGWWKRINTVPTLVAPQWTLDELLSVRLACWPQLGEDLVGMRFAKYGGIVRAVMGGAGSVDKYEEILAKGVADLSETTLHKLLAGDLTGLDGKNTHVCSGLYSIEPPADGTYYKKRSTVTLASVYTGARLAGALWQALERDGRGGDARFTAWFERMCAHVLSQGGTFDAVQLGNKGTRTLAPLVLEPSSLDAVPAVQQGAGAASASSAPPPSGTDEDEAKEEGASPSPNELAFYEAWAGRDVPGKMLAPCVTNLPVVDFADVAYRGYQATVSHSHPISYAHCAALLKVLDAQYLRDHPGAKELPKLQLYFVVPDHVVPHFKRQSFKSPPKTNKLLDRVEQFVVGVTAGRVESFAKIFDTFAAQGQNAAAMALLAAGDAKRAREDPDCDGAASKRARLG